MLLPKSQVNRGYELNVVDGGSWYFILASCDALNFFTMSLVRQPVLSFSWVESRFKFSDVHCLKWKKYLQINQSPFNTWYLGKRWSEMAAFDIFQIWISVLFESVMFDSFEMLLPCIEHRADDLCNFEWRKFDYQRPHKTTTTMAHVKDTRKEGQRESGDKEKSIESKGLGIQ